MKVTTAFATATGAMASSMVCVTNHNHKQQSDTLRRGHILLQTQNQNEVFLELVDTERTYVRDLGILVNGLLVPLRRSLRESQDNSEREPILSEEQIRALFMNVEDLLKHHKGLLHRVEWIMLWSGPYTKASTLGNLFLQECQFFQDYTPFLEGYNNALTLCETLKATNPAFASLLTEFDATRHRNGEMAFESILITPAQRIPRYELMFRELSRHLADNREVRDAQNYVSKTMRLLEEASSAAAAAAASSAAVPSRSATQSFRAKPPLSQKDKEEMAQRRRSLSLANASSSSFMKKMRRKSAQISSVLISSSSSSSSSTASSLSSFPSSSPSPSHPSSTSSVASPVAPSLALALSNSDSQVPMMKAGTVSPPYSPCGSDSSPRSPTSSSEFAAVAAATATAAAAPEEDPSSSSLSLSSSSGGRPTRPSLFKNFSRKLRRKDSDEADLGGLPPASSSSVPASSGGGGSPPVADHAAGATNPNKKNRSWRTLTKPKES